LKRRAGGMRFSARLQEGERIWVLTPADAHGVVVSARTMRRGDRHIRWKEVPPRAQIVKTGRYSPRVGTVNRRDEGETWVRTNGPTAVAAFRAMHALLR
jgi:hypothetical protein